MKNFIKIVLCFVCAMLTSCSAQQRLARLLANHPELHRVDTLIICDTIVQHAQVESAHITQQQLDSMQRAASTTRDSANKDGNVTASVVAGKATAAITADGTGGLYLTAVQTPDTIFVKHPIEVPTYYTDTKIEKVVCYEMKPGQRFFFWFGIVFMVLIVLRIAWLVFKKFYGK